MKVTWDPLGSADWQKAVLEKGSGGHEEAVKQADSLRQGGGVCILLTEAQPPISQENVIVGFLPNLDFVSLKHYSVISGRELHKKYGKKLIITDKFGIQ